MAVSGVGAVGSGGLSRAAIDQEDFLKVLLAQLRYQDPLKPMDNTEFIAQFAQLTSLEQTQQMNEKIDQLLALQSSTQAVSLLGKTVEAATDTGSTIGEVVTVAFQNGSPTMTLKTGSGAFVPNISLGQISLVR